MPTVPAACDAEVDGTACLCADGVFLKNSMKAIWQHCGCAVLENSAAIANENCTGSALPLAVSQAQMILAGDGGLDTCKDPPGLNTATVLASDPTAAAPLTAASTSTSTSRARGGNGGGGLSTKNQIIISVLSVVVGVVGIIVALLAWLRPRFQHVAERVTSDTSIALTAQSPPAQAPAAQGPGGAHTTETGSSRPPPSRHSFRANS